MASAPEPAGMSRDERIAARLIAALEPLMPATCTTAIAAGWLTVAIDGNWQVSLGLAVDERLPDREAALAFNVLSAIQDVIVRDSARPWPSASDPTELPYPAAVVRQGSLLAWFGSEAHPTLAIPPIDLRTA